MSRPTVAYVNLDALRHNCSVLRRFTKSKLLGVVKANAYGHGLVECAKALDVEAVAVASIEEALVLRHGGIVKDVVLLEGIFSADELPVVEAHGFDLVVHHTQQVSWLLQHAMKRSLRVWLKVDTGMHRLGFDEASAVEALHALSACTWVKDIVIMSHPACADEVASQHMMAQIECFNGLQISPKYARSFSNSAATLAWPDAHHQWVRPGIALYGASPLLEKSAEALGLRPVMSLCSEIIAVRECKVGESVGYGADYIAESNRRIATVAIGYADGYPRHAPEGTPVIVNGRVCRLVGRVSMDMITVDVTEVDEPRVGMPVELWGDQLSVDVVAGQAGTISYELLTHVHQRVPRVYEGDAP